MDSPPRDPRLDALIAVVREVAAREVMPRFLAARAVRKPDGSLLTEADTAAQAALIPMLRAIADVPSVGEEMTPAEQLAAWNAGDAGLWVIDPIDGTTNFVQGLPYFALSVALLERGRPVLGVVYNPVTDELFSANATGGATLNGAALASGPAPALARSVAAVEPKYLPRGLAAELAMRPPFYSQRNWGAGALDWCCVAAGRFDVYAHGGQKLWDYAAGALVLAEAGGALASFESDDFWSTPPWTRSIIAARDPALFEAWARWLREHLGSI